MKKLIKKAAGYILAAVLMTSSVSVTSASISVRTYAAEAKWDSIYDGNKCSSFSVDTATYYGTSGYSIRISNSNYNAASVTKEFAVKKNTHYRASVMVRYSDFSVSPDADKEKCGATIGENWSYNITELYHGSEWKQLTFEFNSGDADKYSLALYNGLWGSQCKGTAWFSDFRLEECSGLPSKSWNILAVVFKNVEAPVVIGGKQQIYKDTLNDSDVKYMTGILNRLYTSLPLLSEDMWKVNSIDVVSVDDTVTELIQRGNVEGSYMLDPNSQSASRAFDSFIEKAAHESGKEYDQIIAILPLKGVAIGWLGLGGLTYKNINFCQTQYRSGTESYTDRANFHESVFVHEMLHCVERISRDVLKSPTQDLHAKENVYLNDYWEHGQNGWQGWGTYYSDYIRCHTPDGMGVDSNALNTYSTRGYTVVYGNAYPKKDVTNLEVSVLGAYAHTGKAIKPEPVVKDGTKTLVNGRDYTLSYINNTDIGYAAVVINGKGAYSGKTAVNFRIVPSRPALKVKYSNNAYVLSWGAVSGADRYQVYRSTDSGSSYELVKEVNGDEKSVTIKSESDKKVRFMVSAVTYIYPQTFTGKLSKPVEAEPILENLFKSGKLYSIKSKCSGLAVNPNGKATVQNKYSGKAAQKWYLEFQANGSYVIKNKKSGLVLGVDKNGNVVQGKNKGSAEQQWDIKKNGNYYTIVNRGSGQSLDLSNASKEQGARIIAWAVNGNDNQLWSIKAV